MCKRRAGYSIRHFTSSYRANHIPKRNVFAVAAMGVSISCLLLGNNTVGSDIKKNEPSMENSVSVDSSISPFANFLSSEQKNLHTDYQLLGKGVRTVTFLNFKVYGIGIYVAKSDISTIKRTLKAFKEDSIETLLNDPVKSAEVISQLLDQHVRFTVRICPIRNTDFNHLKDGLIKSILAHPKSKELRGALNEGLEELRGVFKGHRGSVPKNHALWIELLKDGKLSFSYENTKTHELVDMGTVSKLLVGKLLFLQYLSGSKPLSRPLRESCAEGFSVMFDS